MAGGGPPHVTVDLKQDYDDALAKCRVAAAEAVEENAVVCVLHFKKKRGKKFFFFPTIKKKNNNNRNVARMSKDLYWLHSYV